MEHRKLHIIFTLMLSLFSYVHSFRIKHCKSNKIVTVTWNELENKAVIKFGDNVKIIPGKTNADLKIWCEADNLVDKCFLEHQSKTNVKACEYSLPLSCSQEKTCIYPYKNRINYESTSSNKCEFQFSTVMESGI